VRALRLLDQRAAALRGQARDAVAAALGDPGAAALAAGAMLDDAAARAIAAGSARSACGPGCAFCCHVHVEVSAPEVRAVVEHLQRTRSRAELGELARRLVEQAARVRDLDDQQRWAQRLPCALLDEAGACSIHPARPLRCRAFHAAEVEPCREAFAGGEGEPVVPRALARAAEAVEEGYAEALAGAGIAAGGLRLEIALAEALG
jgi:Fe-S-cluster containining protein